MLVGRTHAAREELLSAVRDGRVGKRYLALAGGKLSSPEGEVELHFSSRYKRSRKITVSDSGSK